jgi:hypothetical protein
MTEPGLAYRWSPSEFMRAYEAGAFDHRVELVEGEIWPVVIGSWHGDSVGQILALLPRSDVRLSTSTLPTGASLPDPDCWVRRADAVPTGVVGSRLSKWNPADVLLVVEVSDETVLHDLNTKAALYGSAGYPVYWVVTRERLFEHTEPTATGYRHRTEYQVGEQVPVAYAGVTLPVAELLVTE